MVELLLTILYVQDIPRSTAFYSVFGWKQTVDVPTYAEYELNGSARLGLMVRGSTRQFLGEHIQRLAAPESIKSEIYLVVDDVRGSIRKLEDQHASCTSPLALRDWGDEAAYFLDPDGHVVVVANRPK